MNIVNEDIIKKILTSNDPQSQIKVIKWDVDNAIVASGTNYASEVSRLTIYYDKDGTERKKVLFLKVPINSPMYEMYKFSGAYEKEMLMYTKVLPQIYTIEEEYFTARHHLFDDKMSIFLKDLSLSGYKNVDRPHQLDVEHSCYALKCLAKFHAISTKIEKTIGIPDKVKNDHMFHPDNKDMDVQNMFLSGFKMFIDILPSDIKQKYPQQVVAFQSVTWESIVEDMFPKRDSFNVLNHGDFWINNIMFKYDKYGILKKVKLLDFQLSRWTNPALDLIYFFITSVDFEVFEKYSELLLDTYLSTLNKVLNSLDCATYKLEELVNDIESRVSYAYSILSCALIPGIMADPSDPFNMDDLCTDGKVDCSSFAKVYRGKRYVEFVTKWFARFAEKGILGNKNKKNRFSTDELTDAINTIKP